MNDFFAGLQQLLRANRKAQKELSDGAEKMLNGLESRRLAFEKKQKRVEDDIKRGGRLTKHRISL